MGNDWNDFMQSRPVRIVFSLVIAVVTAVYAVQAVMGLANPNPTFVESLGTTGYTALMVAQAAVCVWVSVAFVRQALKAFHETDDGSGQ